MAVDRRRKGLDWRVVDEAGSVYESSSYAHAQLAVLMDIRDELKALNRLLAGPSFIGIPATLRSIRRKLPTPPKGKR